MAKDRSDRLEITRVSPHLRRVAIAYAHERGLTLAELAGIALAEKVGVTVESALLLRATPGRKPGQRNKKASEPSV